MNKKFNKKNFRKNNIINIVTESGFKCSINKQIFNDYNFLQLLNKAEKNGVYLVDLIEKVLGEKQVEKLVQHVTNSEGFAETTKISLEMRKIFDKVGKIIKK